MKGEPNYQKIKNKATEILKRKPVSLGFTELTKAVDKELPGISSYAVISTWHPDKINDKVFKPKRGLFKYNFGKDDKFFTDEEEDTDFIPNEPDKKEITKKNKKFIEKDFYIPIAEYLKKLGDCDKAESLGGSSDKKKKWYTPDVLGIRKSDITANIKFEPEIVSVEVKIDTSDAIKAFGQAISYRLFSAKVYLFEPHSFIDKPEFKRIESLCLLFGIGLILFNDKSNRKPDWEIRARAQRAIPDLTWSNKFLDKMRETNHDIWKKLF
ncbi:MAG TPA: hypothetical protein VIK14_16575 [Ignavibacteria bacterium]